MVSGQKTDEIIMLYERQLSMGRKDAANKIAEDYPWVTHSDSEFAPEMFELDWQHFNNLHITRSRGLGVTAITYAEIQSYDALNGADLTPSCVKIIRNIDNLYLKAEAEKPKDN